MTDLDKFAEGLIDMAHSPVKADRDAISRIQHKTGMNLSHLLSEVESANYSANWDKANENESKTIQKSGRTIHVEFVDPVRKIKGRTAGAIVGAGMSAIVMLAANAKEIVPASAIGACVGAVIVLRDED